MMPRVTKIYRWLLDLYELTDNEQKTLEYKAILSKIQLGTKTIISGLPGEKLFQALESLSNKNVHIGNSKDVFNSQVINVMNPNWLSEYTGDVIYVPMQYFGALNAKFEYKFIFIKDEPEQVMEYMNGLMKMRKSSFNPELLADLLNLEKGTMSWFNQQPNLDISYVNDIDKLDVFV